MKLQTLLAVGILALLLVGNILATYNYLTEPHPGHNDFLSRWEGARSFWRDDLDPYGDQATLNIQVRIHGRAAREGEDLGYFAYPFYTLFLVWPLVYVSYAWASAIWMVLLEVCLIGSLFLLLNLFGWRPRPWLLALLLLWTLIYYPAARGLLLGQVGHVVYFCEVLTLWALAKKRDRLAGVALAISTVKPQMGFLFVPFLLLWGWQFRRWNFVGSFGAMWGGLMLVSFALEPGWIGGWVDQLQQYTSYTAIGAPVEVLSQEYLGLGQAGEWVINLALWSLMLWAWYRVLIHRDSERLDWTIMLTLTVTHLSAVRTATPHFVVFTIPLVFYFRALVYANRRWGSLWIAVCLLMLWLLPWVQFLVTVEGDFEHYSLYLPLPFGSLILLWLMRRRWWSAGSFIVSTKPALQEG
ncbi:MAG: DUF2029 domain-containing protein [Chloroflexi bacterium]|nr:DUF2029 domain-containing protein [Chloroflexota bacterium]